MKTRMAVGGLVLPVSVLLASVAAPQAHAYILDRQKIALLVESTITDLDSGVAATVLGDGVESDFAYSSVYSDFGWQGTMSGFHNGHSVSVGYTGTLTPIAGPVDRYVINYSTLWNVDGVMSSSAGTAEYIDLTEDTARGVEISPNFKIDFATGTFGGGLSVSYGITSLSVSAQKNTTSGVITAEISAAILDIPGVGAFADVTGTVNYSQTFGTYNSSLTCQAGFGLYSRLLALNVGTTRGAGGTPGTPGTGGTNTQSIRTPTPGAAVALLGAAHGLALRRRRGV